MLQQKRSHFKLEEYHKMYISVVLIIFPLLFTYSKAVEMKTHWTDIVPRTYIRLYGSNAATKQETSDTFLNEQSRRRTFVQKGKNFNAGVPFGHTKSKDLRTLSKKRNEYEDRVNGGLISGMLLKKVDKRLSPLLFKYALEQRQKFKGVQRSYIQKESEGHINLKAVHLQQSQRLELNQEKHMNMKTFISANKDQKRKDLKRKRSKVMNHQPDKE